MTVQDLIEALADMPPEAEVDLVVGTNPGKVAEQPCGGIVRVESGAVQLIDVWTAATLEPAA